MAKSTKEIINENKKYFGYYTVIPKVVSVINAVVFFILGLVFGVIYKKQGSNNLLLYWVCGGVSSIITYFVLKIVLSYKILHIYYLQKIAGESEEIDIMGNIDKGNSRTNVREFTRRSDL